MSNNVKKDLYLLVVVLFDDSYLDEILLGIESISGGMVITVDGVAGIENISHAIPIFAELVGMSGRKICKILFSAVTVENPASRLIEILDEAGLDFAGLSVGEIYTIKLSEAVVVENIEI